MSDILSVIDALIKATEAGKLEWVTLIDAQLPKYITVINEDTEIAVTPNVIIEIDGSLHGGTTLTQPLSRLSEAIKRSNYKSSEDTYYDNLVERIKSL